MANETPANTTTLSDIVLRLLWSRGLSSLRTKYWVQRPFYAWRAPGSYAHQHDRHGHHATQSARSPIR